MVSIEIRCDGQVALTTGQAAALYGLELASMRKAISRLGLEPVAELDGRTPLFLADHLDAAMRARPGKGANLRARQ